MVYKYYLSSYKFSALNRKRAGGYMKKGILIALCILAVCSLVYPGLPDYIGAKKCKPCHTGPKHANVYEKWEAAVHARAFKTLKAIGEEKNPKCLKCHVTGYNEGGYKTGAPNAPDFEGVQCESCHGAGSEYVKLSVMKEADSAVGHGLIVPMESLCIKCHNEESPTFKGFNYQEALKKITHIYRKHW
jgi:hypothetical protein